MKNDEFSPAQINVGSPNPTLQLIQGRITDTVRAFLAEASVDASSAFRRYVVRVQKAADPFINHLVELIMQEVAWNKLAAQFSDELIAAYEAGGMAAVNTLQAGSTEILRDAAILYAKKRAAEMVGMRWVGDKLVENPNADWAITDTTRDTLRRVITDGLEAGLSTEEIAEAIKSSTAFSMYRATMIGVTEASLAQVQGGLGVWKRSGKVKRVAIILSPDHPKLDICDDVAGEYDLQDCPRVPVHPFCICTVIPVELEDGQ